MSLRITKLRGDVTKIESGQWVSHSCGDSAYIWNERVMFDIERDEIDDLVKLLTELKVEMIREHHG